METEVMYTIYANGADDAIDTKNKILANTIDVEKVKIDIYVNKAYTITN